MKHCIVTTTPPPDFAPTMQVASLYCTSRGRFLLLKSSEHKAFGGTWSAPGGKLEPDESPQAAALRETFEETGLNLDPNAIHFYETVYVRYPHLDFVYHVFYIDFTDTPKEILLQPKEHSAYVWATPKEMASLPLMPGAHECYIRLYGNPPNFRTTIQEG